jgi:integrase
MFFDKFWEAVTYVHWCRKASSERLDWFELPDIETIHGVEAKALKLWDESSLEEKEKKLLQYTQDKKMREAAWSSPALMERFDEYTAMKAEEARFLQWSDAYWGGLWET